MLGLILRVSIGSLLRATCLTHMSGGFVKVNDPCRHQMSS